MQNKLVKKGLALGLILLFVGVSIVSSFNTENQNNLDDIKNWKFIDINWFHNQLIDNKLNIISDDDYNYDVGSSVQQTSDGGYIVGGYTVSHDTTSGELLYYYAVMYKFNTYGHIEWKKAFSGLGLAAGITVQQTDDDGFILVGYTAHESGEDTQVLLLKTDQLGNIEWETTYQVMDVCMGYSVQQTQDGGYILSGSAISSDTNMMNILLVKTDNNGIMEWNNTYNNGDYTIGYSVQQTNDHGYIVCGYRFNFDFDIEMDAFLIKTDPNGNEEWTKILFTEMSQSTSCQQTNDSGYILTGTIFSDQENASLAFLLKLDNGGYEEWNRTYSVLGNASGSSVQQTSDNGYIITGSTYDNFEESVDVLLLKTDIYGNQNWNRTFEFPGLMAAGSSVDQTYDDGYIITGMVNDNQFPLPSPSYGILIKSTSNGSEEWIKYFKWASSNTFYVGGSGPANFTKIQDAIDNASDGDTVFVYNGTYYENVIIDKTINLFGEDRNTTIVDGGGVGKVVSIYADRVNVSGFTIQKSGIDFPNAGIYIGSNFNNISNNIIAKNKFVGIKLHPSFNTIIYGNIIRDNQGNGIDIARGSGEGCDNNIIKNNSIINNTYSGIGLVELCNNNTIIENTFEDHAYAGIDMWLSSSNIITDNEFINNYFGIQLYESNSNYIFSNTIRDSVSAGIHIAESSNSSKIYHNNLINNTQNAYDECNNNWNDYYPSGGNYWDDYSGEDQNHDGIGDVPYDLPCEHAIDYYPLMRPWGENGPIANFTYEIDGATVTFDASSSYDRDGEIVDYAWDFGDGYTTSGPQYIVVYTYSEPGTYDVILEITDDDGYVSQILKQIEIEYGRPEFEINYNSIYFGKLWFDVTNVGDIDAINLEWVIDIDTVIDIPSIPPPWNGTIDVLSVDETERISTYSFIFGFGIHNIIIKLNANGINEVTFTGKGIFLGPIVIIPKPLSQ